MPPQCAGKSYRSAGVGVIVGVLLLSSATGWSLRRFSFRLSSLLAWRSSFLISRRSLRERSLGAFDEFRIGNADELDEGDADSIAAAVELGLGIERDLSTGDRAEVGLAAADGTAVAAVAGEDVEDADVVDVSAAASVGFTNVFGGAFGGGVASAFIFTRTFSVACRSPVFSQPRSTTTLAIVSLTLRGRSTAWLRVIKGAGTTMA